MPSKLEQMQLQFRQRLKEERMIKIHTDNQQKALSKVQKYDAVHTSTVQTAVTVPKPQPAIVPPQSHHSPIKKGSPGVDRSRPLPPISKEPRNTSTQQASEFVLGTRVPTRINHHQERVLSKPSCGSPNPCGPKPETSPPRNSHSKPVNPEPKISCQSVTTPERKLNQDVKSRLKQAELQRLKANAKAREETSSRNGTISKSSTESRRTTRNSHPVAAAPSRTRPRAQPAASTTMTRKPAASPSKANTRAAPSANTSKDSAPRKPPGPGQEQCTVCGRNFNQDRIEKHRSICKKVSTKKVKVFDATKMRVKGTEAEQFVKKGLPKSDPKPAKKSDWRKKHNDFIEAIRQAKMVQQHLAKGGKVSDLPPPPPSDTSDYVPCPHCGRKFNEAAAERHIPKCKNISCNKKNPVPTRRS
ncbi:Zinc finger C2HC domain-containing protein 1C [Argiope bruennichi]|uniref:Zinc finger C2HC domain-containing protein 1C n=1 Tax=Argiope bruennichi TaxID=94029 RepID=A0A8T0F9D8_ARGBR|nr:Zinc finger C2HC domain-containing protein 1C [Argiope bruennichi]